MKITLISDTHNKHNEITQDLPGGDLLIHAGDISIMGREHEITKFCKWFDDIDNYDHKIFIAGNHDWGFQNNVDRVTKIINSYKSIDYLQDNWLQVGKNMLNLVKIYGSPWQPEFFNWAFNLPKNGVELESKWENIPMDTDILITHSPAFGYNDKIIWDYENLGCELLVNKINKIKPKIHICGHIHSGRGYKFDGHTHYFNASVLGENYQYSYKPWNIDWNPETNEIDVI